MIQEHKISITDVTGKIFIFKSVDQSRKFLTNEEIFWRNTINDIRKKNQQPFRFTNIHSQLQKIVYNILNMDKTDTENLEAIYLSISNQVNSFSRKWLWSGHAFTNALISCHLNYGSNASDMFFEYLQKDTIPPINNKSSFLGIMAAYEYSKNENQIVSMTDSQGSSLETLKENFLKSSDELSNKIFKIQNEAEGIKNNLMSEWEKWTKNSISDWHSYTGEMKSNYDNILRNHKDECDVFLKKGKNDIEAIQQIYHEKLRLSEPAEYWNRTAKKLNFQGILSATLLFGSILFGIGLFRDLFVTWIKDLPLIFDLHSFQGVIFFVVGVTLYAYLLKVLSRIMFSSFHLMRDAEEREQLSYLYLSLLEKEKNAFDDKSRDVVFQALFCRSETGLISKESGPTMPGMVELLKMTKTGK